MGMKTTTTTATVRRDADGTYNHGLDRVCVCGRRKGEHDADRPYPGGEFDCDGFKAAKVAKAAAR